MFPNAALLSRFCLLFISISLAACTTDQLPEPDPGDCANVMPTYSADIESIIEQSCAYSGCHLGDAPGVYNSYAGLLPVLESGEFRNRVVDIRTDPNMGMPPNDAPTGRPTDLSDAQIELINCWLAAGFPE